MAEGPGKYDDVATIARVATKAKGIIIIVLGGELGNGFSVQMEAPDLEIMPGILRDLADQIEKDMKVMTANN
jgi:hypothetical protein